MLTADLAMSWRRGRRTGPRYINPRDPNMLQVADDLITLFHQHEGQRRGQLEQALHEYIGVATDYQLLRGLIKLLMDRCLFDTTSPLDPVMVRQSVFLKARRYHPVADSEAVRQRVLAEVAAELNHSAAAVEQSLFADLPEHQRLVQFSAITAAELLDQYNLAQAQALLYRCIAMDIWLAPQEPTGYRRLFDAIKCYRLMHTIRGTPQSGYEIRLDGPVSLFHRSQKYGVQMAVFLPALLRCRHWRMKAEIEQKRGSAFFELTSDQHGLRPPEPDEPIAQPTVSEKLIANLNKSGYGWRAEPSCAVITVGQSVFIPDVVFRRAEHQEQQAGHPQVVYLEIVGFWTPRWIKERLVQLERAGLSNFLLAASTEFLASRDALPALPPNVIVFQTSLDVRAVREALEAIRVGP